MSNTEILTSIEDPERDNEDENSEEMEDNSTLYNMKEILDKIGNLNDNSFEYVYNLFIDGIKEKNIETQKSFCVNILLKLEEEFDIQIAPFPKIEEQEDFDRVYDLVYFIQSDFTRYIPEIISGSNLTIKNNFINKDELYVIKDIEKKILNISREREDEYLIKYFLDFCDRDVLLDIVLRHLRRSKVEIFCNMNLKNKKET